MRQRLKELCELPGVSGREDAVRAYILQALKDTPTDKQITVDSLGNVLCHIQGKEPPKTKVMFTAHMDEVGLIITNITQEGYLRFSSVGGIEPAVLCGKSVTINGFAGVIGCKAVHLCDKDEKEKAPKELLIDIGASSFEQASALVQLGDVAVFDTVFTEMQDKLLAKALDDRVGCALLLELAKETPPYDIDLAFTVQEEIGLRGAGPAAFTVRPDISVTVEATTAADIAGASEERTVCKVGEGPVVSFMDKATMYDHTLYRQVRGIADQFHIPNQTKTYISGGNDAAAIQKAAGGTRVCAISVPCRYIHSPSCMMTYHDVELTRQLLLKLTEVLPK